MTVYRFSNFAQSTLQGEIGIADTKLLVAADDVALFPSIGVGEAFFLTIWDRVKSPEIVLVTAVSGQEFTITRGQEGTAGTAWSAGTIVRVAMTKALLESLRAGSLITNLSSPTSGQALFYNGAQWVNQTIAESNVANLVADLAAINASLSSHTHTAAQVASGNPVFTTVGSTAPVALANGTDLNTIPAQGNALYKVSSPTNGPGSGNWLVLVRVYDTSTAYQIATELTGADPLQYIRRKIAGAWTAWKSLPTTESMNTAIASSFQQTFAVAGGTVDAITVDFTPDLVVTDGVEIAVRLLGPNTVTVPQISVDSSTYRDIVRQDSTALALGELNGTVLLRYHAATLKWRVLNPVEVRGTIADLVAADANKIIPASELVKAFANYATIASAATTTFGSNSYYNVTLSASNVSAFAFTDDRAGRTVWLRFAAGIKLVAGASMILPGGTNIVTLNGDTALFVSEGSGVFRCLSYNVNAVGSTLDRVTNGSLSGASVTINASTILQPYSAFRIVISNASHNSGTNQSVQVQVSTDNGTSWSTAYQMTQALGAAVSMDFNIEILDAAQSGTRSVPILSSAVDANGLSYQGSSAQTGPINAIKLLSSGGSFDAGTYIILGLH